MLAMWTPLAWPLEQNRALTQYIHRVWQSPQGLPLASIRSLYQTSDGYLWLGTERGLYRFDGVRFTPASSFSDHLAEDVSVAALFEDVQHNLWIAARSAGLLRLRDGIVSRVPLAAGAEDVTCLVSDAASNLWACTPAGVLEVRNGSARGLGVESGLPRNGALSACAIKDGRIWVGGQGPQIYIWDGQRFTTHLIRSLPAPTVVQSMLASRDGAVWVGTSDGLVEIRDGSEKRLTVSDGLPGNSILSLTESQDGTLWIGTTSGFSRLRKGELESYTTKAGLSQSTIYSILEDRQGSLWVGTKRGLNQFVDRHIVPITTSEGLPSNDTGPVLQDVEGTFWVGTIGAGLARYQGRRRLSVLTTANGLSSNVIFALSGGERGDLWIGTDHGVNRLRQGLPAETWTTRSGLPSDVIKSLYWGPNGTLWIGTAHGLAWLRDGSVTRAGGRTSGNAVVSIERDRRGRVYAAVDGLGVSVFDERTRREIPKEQIAIRNAVSLYEDGTLWIGTLGGGLYLFDHGHLTEYLPKDGLFDDAIFGITSGGGGVLWMACSKGIFSVKRNDLLRFAQGTMHSVVSTPYSPLDGLQTVECKSGVQPAAWHMRDGQISFSTIRGLLLMDPAQAAWRAPAPRAVIEEVVVNGRTLPAAAPPDLSPGTNNVDFVYTGLDLRSPRRITFRYMLEGFNRRWVDAGERRAASFTNLRPGRYRFRLMACAGGTDCTETAGPEVVIPARFYQRAWFPFLCGGIVLAAAWLAYQARIRRLKQQFALTLTERTRIARELHDTLLQGFSGVTMEMQALAQRLPADFKTVLDDIIGDAVNCLRDVRHLLANLRNQQSAQPGLASAIARAASQANGGGDARLKMDLEQTPAQLPAHTEYNLMRIVQEAVTNAMHHSGAGRITVALRSDARRIRLSVTDTGCGFAADGSFEGHYGLLGMKERATEIGADLKISSHPGEGTSVTIELPLSNSGEGIQTSMPDAPESAKALSES
jgi:signal transduction histidine kinase/ligand-binding sensor domain-containing protein